MEEENRTGDILVFDKYDPKEVMVRDKGLERYMNLKPIIAPHSSAKHANRWFGKARVNLVERLINNMMRTGRFTGKKNKAYNVVKLAFESIESKVKTNPLQVLVEAIEKAAPREEITRLRFGGINVPKAVDIAPSRRLDIALRNICSGAVSASHKNKKPIQECLSDEIIRASKGDMNSFAMAKRDELERIAGSAR
jgi:small subunit ribosomal protein S7